MIKSVTIEIHGTGTHNRGAELMAIAIADRMRATFPGVRVVVPPDFGNYDARARHGFWTTWEFPGRLRGRLFAAALRTLSPRARQVLGIADPNEIDVVLDASGFAFSDQWGPRLARSLVRKMSSTSRRGQPLILLPQAFGPFENPNVANWGLRLVNRADLICARDAQSYAALQGLGVPADKLRQYPDFTIGVSPNLSGDLRLPGNFVAIVPNIRMIDKTDTGSAYVRFLEHVINVIKGRGMSPAFVLHEARGDRAIIDHITSDNRFIPILEHEDPRVLKGILGQATYVVGSRFHALVGALSQGVPCVGAGWSHKYKELFADFDCQDLLLREVTNTPELECALDRVSNDETRKALRARLAVTLDKLKRVNESMWHAVEIVIRNAIDHRGAKI